MSEGGYWCLMVSEDAYGSLSSLLVSEGTYWCLRVSNGICVYLMVSEGAYECLKLVMGV